MIRRALCENYIKALLLEDPERGSIGVVSLLDGMMLEYPGMQYVMGLETQLRPPEQFNPKNLRHRATRDFLIRQEVLHYFEDDEDMNKAREILHRPRAREFTESMLLGGAPELAIARRLVDMYRMRGVSIPAIKLYRHYYFNLDLLDSTETRAILALSIDRMCDSDDKETKMQGQALKKASWSDPRRAAANMPHSPISAVITQLQMGFIPDSIDLKKITEQSEALAHYRLIEALSAGGRDYDHRALNLVTTARILAELKEAKLRPEDELKNQLSTLAVKTAETGLPLVHEVTGGRHTVDMAALPKSSASDEPSKK